MLQENYHSKETKFSLWARRMVWNGVNEAISAVISDVENINVDQAQSININKWRNQLIAKLNAIEGINKNSQEYKDAWQKIEQALLRLKKQQEYFTARTAVLADPIVSGIDNASVKSLQDRNKYVQTRANLLKLQSLQQEAKVTEVDQYVWEDKVAILEGALADYYNRVAAKCNNFYKRVSTFSPEAMEDHKNVTDKGLTDWSSLIDEYKVAIAEFRDSQTKSWPGTKQFSLDDANLSADLYFDTEFNYFEAFKAARSAEKIGDKSAEGWLAGAAQKKAAVDNYNLCRNQAREIKALMASDASVTLEKSLESDRIEAGKYYASGVAAMDKSDWVRAGEMFLKALLKYKGIFEQLSASQKEENLAEATESKEGLWKQIVSLQTNNDAEFNKLNPVLKALVRKKLIVPPGVGSLSQNSAIELMKLALDTLKSQKALIEAYNQVYKDVFNALYQHARAGAKQDSLLQSTHRKQVMDYACDISTITPFVNDKVSREDVIAMTRAMTFTFNIHQRASVTVRYEGQQADGRLQARFWFKRQTVSRETPFTEPEINKSPSSPNKGDIIADNDSSSRTVGRPTII